MSEQQIEKGQVWGRRGGRYWRVLSVTPTEAVCSLYCDDDGVYRRSSARYKLPFAELLAMELIQSTPGTPEQRRLAQKIAEWHAENPIRKFVTGAGYSQAVFAGIVGVSVQAVRNWITGTLPTEENKRSVAAAMGIGVNDFDRQWESWAAKRPGV